MAEYTISVGMGRNDRECIQVYTATATFAGSTCVVCARKKEGRLKGLCLLFYELVQYVGFL